MRPCKDVAGGRTVANCASGCRANELKSELSRHRRELQQLLELSPDAIYIRLGTLVAFVNQAAIQMFGAGAADDLIGLNAISLVHASEHERLLTTRQQIEKTGRHSQVIEFKMARIDGSTFEGETFGRITTWEGQQGMLVTVRDISERKLAERRLQESEAKYRTLFEVSPDAILVQIDDRVVFANPAAAAMFGFRQPDDMIGLAVASLVDAPHPGAATRAIKNSPAWYHYRRCDGASFVGQPVSKAVPWNDKPAQLMIVRDMTDHLRAEAEAQQAEKMRHEKVQVEQALAEEQELSGLQRQFVSMVSHEFRTPLAIVDGSAQRLLRRSEKDNLKTDFVQEAVTKIRKSVSRMTGLMESVLSIARLESGKIDIEPEAVDLGGLLTDLCASHAELAPDHAFTIDIDRLIGPIRGDERLLCQVFSNLLSNAVKYSPPDTEIRLDAITDDAGYAVVSVRDRGVGIPPDEVNKLFQRFFRASTSVGIVGTGIGLHLVQHLIDLHGGAIDVSSCVGEGSIFTVKLPPNQQFPPMPGPCSRIEIPVRHDSR